MNVEFISYSGEWPNACSGDLVLKVDGVIWVFPYHALCSGGNVWFDDEWGEHVDEGDWIITSWPDGFPEDAKEKALDVVNASVEHGCCGGCV